MIRAYEVNIPASGGPLSCVVHLPKHIPAPVVVCCHGLLSSKDSEKYIAIGDEFSCNGLAVVRFDFSDCGESNAALGSDLLGSRLRDLSAVLDYVHEQFWADGRVGLLGSSLGGYIALLGARSLDVRGVVCWATPFDLDRVQSAMGDSEIIKGHFPPGFELGYPRNLDSLPAIPGVFIIHGQQDDVVSWREAEEIYHRVKEPKRLLLMQSADHRFLDSSHRKLAIRLSREWFMDYTATSIS